MLVTGVFCYGLDGTMVWARHNCPGSWNDGEMSCALQLKLCDPLLVGENMKLASDSAFSIRGDIKGKIVTPLKEGDLERIPPECRSRLGPASEVSPRLSTTGRVQISCDEKPRTP